MGSTVHARLLAAAARVAREQYGVIAWEQLRTLQIDSGTVSAWVDAEVMHRIHPTVYAIGHDTLTHRGDWMAAQLWGMLLSHDTAAMIHHLTKTVATRPHVTVRPTESVRSRRLTVHRSPVPDEEIATVGRWRVTSWSRTILDIAAAASDRRVRELLDAAIDARLYDQRQMDATIARARGHHGLKHLKPAVATLQDSTATYRSRTERRIREELAALGLPSPLVNQIVNRGDGSHYELDLYWPAAGIVVELDGPQHALPFQRSLDEVRDAWLWHHRAIRTLRYPVRSVRAETILRDLTPHLLQAR